MSTTKTQCDDVKNDDAKNVETTTKKTFKLTTLCDELSQNPKHIRARFRRYASCDDETLSIVELKRCKNAKSRWVYPNDMRETIIALIKRDDDE